MSVGVAAPGTNKHTGARAPPGPPITGLVAPKQPKSALTANKETDTRTAITRGLAEYVEGLVVERPDGREIRLQQVFSSWAEPEDNLVWPAAIAYTPTIGTYEASKLSTVLNPNCQLPAPDGRFAVSPSEYTTAVVFEVWATDPEERTALVGALEDAFNPFLGQYGFTLELPHYHNVRATYEPTQMGYMDTETDAIQRARKAMFTLEARMPLIKLVSAPFAKPRLDLAAVGDNVIVDGTAPC